MLSHNFNCNEDGLELVGARGNVECFIFKLSLIRSCAYCYINLSHSSCALLHQNLLSVVIGRIEYLNRFEASLPLFSLKAPSNRWSFVPPDLTLLLARGRLEHTRLAGS